MYEAPITQYITDIHTRVENQLENHLMEILFGLGFDVDKEELIKALKYDREQYQKGFKDGKESIVHCEHCTIKKAVQHKDGIIWRCPHRTHDVKMDGYCESGVRADGEFGRN